MAIILVVEDELSVQGFLGILLTPDHQVIQALNAEQAIELAQVTPPDLVLLDLNLQGHQDGLEVCQTLRKNPDPILAQVPILMLTGSTTQEVIGAALAAGVDSYVGKPYSPHSLLALIEILLAKKD
jgi:two-component system nitrogen regulation response regulator NtrX